MTYNFSDLYQRFVDNSLQFEGDPHSEDDLLLQIDSCVDGMFHKGLDPNDLPTDTLVMGLYNPDEFSFLVNYASELVDDSLECF